MKIKKYWMETDLKQLLINRQGLQMVSNTFKKHQGF